MDAVPPSQERTGARDRLLDAAESVVVREGVSNLTLEAVAREAGVSKGGLLYHFPNKAALITAVVQRLVSQCEADQCRAMAGDSQEAGAFTRAYVVARNEPLDPQQRPIYTALLVAAGMDPQYLEPCRERAREWQARLESDGIDPAIAVIVKLAIDGLCFGDFLGMPLPTGELHRRVIDKLLSMTSKE